MKVLASIVAIPLAFVCGLIYGIFFMPVDLVCVILKKIWEEPYDCRYYKESKLYKVIDQNKDVHFTGSYEDCQKYCKDSDSFWLDFSIEEDA